MTCANLWQLVTTCDDLWRLEKTCDNLCQLGKNWGPRQLRYWMICQIWKGSQTDRQTEDGVTAKVTTREACASKNTRKFGLSLSFCNTYKNAMESDNRLVNEDSLEDNFRHLLVVSNIFLFVVVINCKYLFWLAGWFNVCYFFIRINGTLMQHFRHKMFHLFSISDIKWSI